jgi:hypothetical protein
MKKLDTKAKGTFARVKTIQSTYVGTPELETG